MSRRPSLPGAAELFRVTGGSGQAAAPGPGAPERVVIEVSEPAFEAQIDPDTYEHAPPRKAAVRQTGRRMRPAGERRPSGRQKHEEKITVYCSPEELLDLEQARL